MSNVVLKGFQKRIIPQALDVPDSSIDRFFRNPKSRILLLEDTASTPPGK